MESFSLGVSGDGLTVHKANRSTTLSVINRGVPVAPSEQKRVWEKNFRGQYVLKRAVKGEEGTGFGLYLARGPRQAKPTPLILALLPSVAQTNSTLSPILDDRSRRRLPG